MPRASVSSKVREVTSQTSAANGTFIDVDGQAALQRVLHLMSIPGKSGQERQVVECICEQLRLAGVPDSAIEIDDANSRSPIGGNTGNLIVHLPGTLKKPRRLLMGHLDTVPLCVGSKPVRQGDIIRSADPATALGGDDRSGASVILTALLEILKHTLPHPPLTFFWPVQEEIGLFGARLVDLKRLKNPKLCFNWDGGTPSNACLGATGSYDIEIEIAGIASHAGVHPEAGVSAIGIAGLAIADLVQNGWHGLIRKGKNQGTSNLGIIGGGDATNVVTSSVKISAEVRSHDRKFRDRLLSEFQKAFLRAAKGLKNNAGKKGRVTFTHDLRYESFRLDENEQAVQVALSAIRAVNLTPQTRISNGGLDANWLSARGLPTVTLGSGQRDVHTVDESLGVTDYLHACRIAVLLATAQENVPRAWPAFNGGA